MGCRNEQAFPNIGWVPGLGTGDDMQRGSCRCLHIHRCVLRCIYFSSRVGNSWDSICLASSPKWGFWVGTSPAESVLRSWGRKENYQLLTTVAPCCILNVRVCFRVKNIWRESRMFEVVLVPVPVGQVIVAYSSLGISGNPDPPCLSCNCHHLLCPKMFAEQIVLSNY